MNIGIELPPEVVEQIARRAAQLVSEREVVSVSPWLDTKGAAEYIAAPVGRIHDLVGLRKLTPRRDGRRLLFHRADLDRYLEGGESPEPGV
jgi:excisionase family DNA binding protein